MVVLSVSICTRSGKALVSRQYVEMTRMRVEGLLAAFPKLIGQHAKQHTFVETDTVRYVYQPLENALFLLLVTTKASNIVEDLSTLRLLAKVVPDVSGQIYENAINEAAFELIFAFDEVLTAGGYREDNATLASIKTNLQMDSHEEKMATLLKESKEEAAKAEMIRKQKEIGQRQKQALMQAFANQNGIPTQGGGMPGSSNMAGFGGGGPMTGFGSDNTPAPFEYDDYPVKTQPVEPERPRISVKGMKLGSKGAEKNKNIMAMMAAEDNFALMSNQKAKLTEVVSKPSLPAAPVTISLEEKINVQMNRDGGVDSCEVKGTLSVTANTAEGSAITLAVNKPVMATICVNGWTFATHPKIHKSTYEKSGVLQLKDAAKGGTFPLGRPVAVLRWTYQDVDAAPLTINYWPEDQGDGTIVVNIDFEFLGDDKIVLENVDILMPLGVTDPPVIESIDGHYKHDKNSGILCWHHDIVDSNNASGSMEFIVPGSDTQSFFPVMVKFHAKSLFCPVQLENVQTYDSKQPVANNMVQSLVPDLYQVA